MYRVVDLAARCSSCEVLEILCKVIVLICHFQLYRCWVLRGGHCWVHLLPLLLLISVVGQLPLIDQGRPVSTIYRVILHQAMAHVQQSVASDKFQDVANNEFQSIPSIQVPIGANNTLRIVKRAAGNNARWKTPMARS